jgi:hypothetical protein
LKLVLKNPRKFLCLNDNINYKLVNEAGRLKDLLENFYITLFPLKSEFEKNFVENNVAPASDDLTNFIFIPFVFILTLLIAYILICNCFDYNIDIRKRRLMLKRKWRLKQELKRELVKTSNDSSSSIESDIDKMEANLLRKSTSKNSFII